MAYPHIARGQYMKKEPPDKFICLLRQGLLTVTVGIISPEKRNLAVPDSEDAVIADGDSMGISASVPAGVIRYFQMAAVVALTIPGRTKLTI